MQKIAANLNSISAGTLVVRLAMLLHLINCRFTTIIIIILWCCMYVQIRK